MSKPEDNFYIHSRCCNAHWELMYSLSTNEYFLLCENCGKPSGISVMGPDLTGCSCEICGEEDIDAND